MSTDSLTPDTALAERLDRAKPTLALASLRYMEADPFWKERYGERADRFAREDAAYHVTYLITAVWEGSVTPLREYARWLRSVLVSRGMCTRHLAAHFEELQKTLRTDSDIAPAAGHLQAAIDALIYDEPAAAALQADASRIASTVADQAGFPRGHSAVDPEHLVHYVADAIAAGHDRWLTEHLRWLFQRFGADGRLADVRSRLERLSRAIAADGAHGSAAADTLDRAVNAAQAQLG